MRFSKIVATGILVLAAPVVAGCGAGAVTPTPLEPTNTPSDPTAWPPKLTEATTIGLQNDWAGFAPDAPLEAHYTLERGADGFSGEGNFSMGGYSGDPVTAWEAITVPADVAQKFLQVLEDPNLPMKEGPYEPRIDHTDDYPSVGIQIGLPGGEQVSFYSGSQGVDYVPWGLSYKGKTYTVDSALPAKAMYTLGPYLKREEVLGRLEQQMMNRSKTPTP